MDETSENLAAGGKTNLFSKFAELPTGVQRIIIAVLLLLILAAAMFLQRMIRVEEDPEADAIPFETAASFAAEVQREA
jgi:hypothetical protein